MRKCVKCGLPENYADIRFDKEGICNYCNFYDQHRAVIQDEDFLKEKFREKIAYAKKKARENQSKYDCLVGFSGGKDSTYIIYQLKHKYHMRVLAFTFDNGFMTDYGKANIKNALEKINVDHIMFSVNEKRLRQQYSACFKMMKNFCAVCFHNMHYYSYLLAHQNGIPMIVNGRTMGQILQTADETYRLEPFETSDNLLDFEHQMFLGLEQKARKIPEMDYLEEIRGIEAVSYFAYHKISEEETRKFLEEKIGWQRPKGISGHADCFAHAMAEYMCMQKHGYPVRTGELAVLVRRGEITKEEAEAELLRDSENFQELPQEVKDRFYHRIQLKK
ncbi:MAG: hypothetical protein K2M46_03865 [Lachnospiraceae bacterium]|nr:hypothetical protein [Lachnospiraceae bacterium]